MPELQAPFTLAAGEAAVPYSDTIEAAKVVDLEITRSGVVTDGGSDAVGDYTSGIAIDFTYTIEATGEDDLEMPATPVSVSGATNCTAIVQAQPASLVLEPGDTITFIVRVTPTATGVFDVDVSLDNDSTSGKDPYNFNINGEAYDPPSITNSTLVDGDETLAYSDFVDVTGGKTPLVFSISSGTLPAGVTLNTGTGELSGVPSEDGDFNFTVEVGDDLGATDTQAYTLTIVPLLIFGDDFSDGDEDPFVDADWVVETTGTIQVLSGRLKFDNGIDFTEPYLGRVFFTGQQIPSTWETITIEGDVEFANGTCQLGFGVCMDGSPTGNMGIGGGSLMANGYSTRFAFGGSNEAVMRFHSSSRTLIQNAAASNLAVGPTPVKVVFIKLVDRVTIEGYFNGSLIFTIDDTDANRKTGACYALIGAYAPAGNSAYVDNFLVTASG